MKSSCLACNGTGHAFVNRPMAMYGGMMTRFWVGRCKRCAGTGRITLGLDAKQLAAGENNYEAAIDTTSAWAQYDSAPEQRGQHERNTHKDAAYGSEG